MQAGRPGALQTAPHPPTHQEEGAWVSLRLHRHHFGQLCHNLRLRREGPLGLAVGGVQHEDVHLLGVGGEVGVGWAGAVL